MMQSCSLFDEYRDGELSRVAAGNFEAHLAECAECRAKMTLLNNLAFILRQDPAVMPVDLSGQIAGKAFGQKKTWDALVIGWLRPGPAFAALALVCVLFSALWFVPNYQPISANSEYEKLMDKIETINLDNGIQKIQNDTELISVMEQEVKSR